MKFSEVSFFYFILPPIIFAAGYTLKHKNFVKNLGHIMMLGVIGTIISMIVLSMLLIFSNGLLSQEQIKPAECILLVSNSLIKMD